MRLRTVKKQVRRNSRRQAGFTLMEVMLVLVIIAAIAGIAVLNIGSIRGEAFKRTAKADISNLKNMLSQYEMMVGNYPSSLDSLYAQPSDLADPTKWSRLPATRSSRIPGSALTNTSSTVPSTNYVVLDLMAKVAPKTISSQASSSVLHVVHLLVR